MLMPSKNVVKIYLPDSFYHAYNRGVNKRVIFKDSFDYAVFLNLLKRHLSKKPVEDSSGREYVWLAQDIDLVAFCLMPNHFHLFLYQRTPDALPKLLKLVSMSYATYFNKKYRRIGPLFQSTYKASRITEDPYLMHISRYIHLNPKQYRTWEFSSLPYYTGHRTAEWLKPAAVLELFNSKDEYQRFLDDYVSCKEHLEDVKRMLANY